MHALNDLQGVFVVIMIFNNRITTRDLAVRRQCPICVAPMTILGVSEIYQNKTEGGTTLSVRLFTHYFSVDIATCLNS